MPSGSTDKLSCGEGRKIRIDYVVLTTTFVGQIEIIIAIYMKTSGRLVSCRCGCLYVYIFVSLVRAVDVFQLVDKSAESCPIFSPTAKVEPTGEDPCFTISRTFRARETNTSHEKRIHRENDAYTSTPGIFGRSTRDLKRRSITRDRESYRSLNSLTVVRGAP